jgi:5-formyltetrahydrofolate cyclo-ligase
MDHPLTDQKRLVRTQFLRKLRGKAPSVRAADSQAICRRLIEAPIWEETRSVLFFAPMPEEPDIWPVFMEIWKHGVTVALPKFDPGRKAYAAHRVSDPQTDLVVGHFGIREPGPDCPEHPINLLDVVLVPGVAFDLRGRRLGRGAGYYDRLLIGVRGTTCGIAFDEQISGELPVEPHDIHVNCILTPTRWLSC